MKYRLGIMLLGLVTQAVFAQTPQTETPKTPIALLGTYHFDNPNLDQFNVKSDNILSEKRQAELDSLVRALAQFKPTRITLEYDRNKSNADQLYQQYLRGEYKLGSSEREQIGFRLAKFLGHPHVYPVDERALELDFNLSDSMAQEFGPLLGQLDTYGKKIINDINGWVSQYSISEILYRLNSDELDRLNVDLYYRFILPIGKDTVQPGANAVASWYKRNLYVLHHIQAMSGEPGKERILVVFGQGHTAMLKQLLSWSSQYELVDVRKYLKAGTK